MRSLLRFAAVGAIAASIARADDLFVDNDRGDDARDGRTAVIEGSVAGPVRSLTRALALAHPSDRIVMADTGQPYRESVTLSGGRHNGTQSAPFIVAGNGAVLEGSHFVPSKAWQHYRDDVFRFRPVHSASAQLFLDGPPAVRRYLDTASGRLPKLGPREWCLADREVYFRVDVGKLPEDYQLTFAALTVGITLYEVHDVLIENLTVQGFQLDGINAHDCANDCTLVGVMSRGNGRAGIAVGGASNVEINGCLVCDNGVAQILTSGPSTTSIEEIEIDAATAPGIVRREGRVFVDGRRFDE